MNVVEEAVNILRKSSHTTAFTGAGVSVESGIPPFRGEHGLWSKYDPVVLDIGYFHSHPVEAWKVIREIFYDYFSKARPNAAHYSLADMERRGQIAAVITQNIDNLHQEAGSKNVYEYHGNSKRLVCPACGEVYPASEVDLIHLPPRCKKDGEVLKPDFVFFGEPIPVEAANRAAEEARTADVFLLIGTTGEVMPASLIPQMAKQNSATILEINPEISSYTHSITDVYIPGKAGEIMPLIAKVLEEK